MGFESSQFGDGSATGSGNVTTQVNNHYGTRTSEKVVGKSNVSGVEQELVFQIDGDMVSAEAFPLLAPVIPAGAHITEAFAHVTEAFVLGGTSPVVEIGTEGSEATNGFTLTEANCENVGVVEFAHSAMQGTWGARLAADTTVGIDLAGTTPTVTSAGEMTVVIKYVLANT